MADGEIGCVGTACAPLMNVGTIPNFTGNPEEFEDFKDQLMFYFEAHNVFLANQRRAVLLSCTGHQTYAIAKKLCAPDRLGTKTFDELIFIMSSHFIPTACVWVERDRFDALMQGPDEAFKDFLADLKQMAERCKFENLDQVLLRQVLGGMRNLGLKELLFSLKFEELTLRVATDRAIAAERARAHVSQFQNGGSMEVVNVQCRLGDSHLV
jgi:hypothetical protein